MYILIICNGTNVTYKLDGLVEFLESVLYAEQRRFFSLRTSFQVVTTNTFFMDAPLR